MKKEQSKAYYQSHKEAYKAYYQANKEKIKAYNKAHKEERKAYKKAWQAAHRESEKAKIKAWYKANKEERKAYQKAYHQANKEKCYAYSKKYKKEDLNALGQTKQSIRLKSWRILKKSGIKIPSYEIHHCFGYEDPSKFIYISKELHLKIHAYLKEHNIDAGSDHWMAIRDIVNSADEFMYIKC